MQTETATALRERVKARLIEARFCYSKLCAAERQFMAQAHHDCPCTDHSKHDTVNPAMPGLCLCEAQAQFVGIMDTLEWVMKELAPTEKP